MLGRAANRIAEQFRREAQEAAEAERKRRQLEQQARSRYRMELTSQLSENKAMQDRVRAMEKRRLEMQVKQLERTAPEALAKLEVCVWVCGCGCVAVVGRFVSPPSLPAAPQSSVKRQRDLEARRKANQSVGYEYEEEEYAESYTIEGDNESYAIDY